MSTPNNIWNTGIVPRPVLQLPAEVSQCELERLTQLQGLAAEYTRLRKSITDRITSGATIQFGRLTATVKEQHSKRFNRKMLEKLLGDAYVRQLHEQLEFSASRRLVISDQSQQVEF
jgi:hypothetical protein